MRQGARKPKRQWARREEFSAHLDPCSCHLLNTKPSFSEQHKNFPKTRVRLHYLYTAYCNKYLIFGMHQCAKSVHTVQKRSALFTRVPKMERATMVTLYHQWMPEWYETSEASSLTFCSKYDSKISIPVIENSNFPPSQDTGHVSQSGRKLFVPLFLSLTVQEWEFMLHLKAIGSVTKLPALVWPPPTGKCLWTL